MANSAKEGANSGIQNAMARGVWNDDLLREFGEKLSRDDFAGAQKIVMGSVHDGALHGYLADLLIIEIETRLENSHAAQAKKCLELLLICAPDRKDEAHMWFADYHMGQMQKSLSRGRIASFGHDLECILEYAPHRKEEAHSLIAQYYMDKLKSCIYENRGQVAESKALGDLMRYGPSRREEAYNLFAERALDEMRHALSNYDKDYAKITMEEFLKYAPHRQKEAQAMWEQHLETARKRKLYDILGIERAATEEEIKQAYRLLAKRLHPDVNLDNPAASEQMRHVNAAYGILGDPELRKRYDMRGDRKEFN